MWGFGLSLIPIVLVAEYSRTRGVPFVFPLEFVIVTIALCALAFRILGGDSR
jgi:hypothetical protein